MLGYEAVLITKTKKSCVQIASFSVGDSRCVLKNDQIRCVRVNIK